MQQINHKIKYIPQHDKTLHIKYITFLKKKLEKFKKKNKKYRLNKYINTKILKIITKYKEKIIHKQIQSYSNPTKTQIKTNTTQIQNLITFWSKNNPNANPLTNTQNILKHKKINLQHPPAIINLLQKCFHIIKSTITQHETIQWINNYYSNTQYLKKIGILATKNWIPGSLTNFTKTQANNYNTHTHKYRYPSLILISNPQKNTTINEAKKEKIPSIQITKPKTIHLLPTYLLPITINNKLDILLHALFQKTYYLSILKNKTAFKKIIKKITKKTFKKKYLHHQKQKTYPKKYKNLKIIFIKSKKNKYIHKTPQIGLEPTTT